MYDDLEDLFIEVVSSTTFQQTFPLVVLIVLPLFCFTAFSFLRNFRITSRLYATLMVLEGLGISWLWSSSASGNHTKSTKHKSHRRTRSKKHDHRGVDSQGIALNELANNDTDEPVDGYFPGLVNISGTYCFMNSTIQALASLSYLHPQIDAIHRQAEALDVPTPVIDALRKLFRRLNKPQSSPSAIRPVDLIETLSSLPDGRSSSLFNSREHQDAQELFQLVSECIKTECANIAKEAARDRGFGGLSKATETDNVKELSKGVFDGLTANRRSCVICGYTEAVMHFSFDSWQLAVPRMASSCLLEDCLEDYTRLEILKDCICRKCSVTATHKRLAHEVKVLTETILSKPPATTSKKRRLRDLKKLEASVKTALDEGRIEDDLGDVKMEKVFSAVSTKQAMIARPPPVLALHLNRSVHLSSYATKNGIRILFPELLDLTPFTTSGSLSTIPTKSLSSPSPLPPRASTPTQATFSDVQARTLYRLSAVVCHYGSHSFGHYICYRRKPTSSKWKPPKLIHKPPTHGSTASKQNGAASSQPITDEEPFEGFSDYTWEDVDVTAGPGSNRGWLRVSDNSVHECGIEAVLQEGSAAFMLYYERVVISAASTSGTSTPFLPGKPVPLASSGYGVGMSIPLDSEETLKPELRMNGNGSVGSFVSLAEGKAADAMSVMSSSPSATPRIVRNVTNTRGRSSSIAVVPSSSTSFSRAKSSSPPRPTQPILINGAYSRHTASANLNGISGDGDLVMGDGDGDDGHVGPALSASAPALLPSKLHSETMTKSHTMQPHNHVPETVFEMAD